MSGIVNVRCVREDGKEFLLGTDSAWRILSDGLEGIDYPKISVYSEKSAVKDGALLTGMRIDDRSIQIKAKTVLTKLNAVLRREAISFFRPKMKYRIVITYQGETRWIDGVIEGFSCPSQNIHMPMKLTVKFYCEDTHLKSVDNFGQNIASITPRFAFPYIQTNKIKIVAESFNFSKTVTINNDGDAEVMPVIRINFKGSCSNPVIKKNDAYVRVLGNFVSGDLLIIDCESYRITKNGENWIHHIDRTSSFTDIRLDVGDSNISFGADTGDSNMAVYVYFNKRYLGM